MCFFVSQCSNSRVRWGEMHKKMIVKGSCKRKEVWEMRGGNKKFTHTDVFWSEYLPENIEQRDKKLGHRED